MTQTSTEIETPRMRDDAKIEAAASEISRLTIAHINLKSGGIHCEEMRYTAQAILEEVIKKLEMQV